MPETAEIGLLPSQVGLVEIMDRLTKPVWVFDIDRSCVAWANPAGCRLWKADSLAELQARDFASGMSVTVANRLKQYQSEFIRAGRVFEDVWTHYPKGVPSTIHVTYSGVRLDDGRMAMLCEGGDQIHEEPEKLRSAEALMHTPVMISLYAANGTLLYSNPAASAVRPGSMGGIGEHLVDPNDRLLLQTQLEQGGEAQIVAEVFTAEGNSWHEINARLCTDPVTGKGGFLSSEVDVSRIKRMEAQARYAASHDPLTGLPNRHFVVTMMQEQLQGILAQAGQAALLFIDLDRFKMINDSLGHARGDEVLIDLAMRLCGTVGERGHVARLGGDEFLVLLELTDMDRLEDTIRRLLDTARLPFVVADHRLQLALSVGVSVAPADGTDLAVLMQNADAAMYRAKRAGGDRRSYFTTEIGRDAWVRMQMEIDLRSDFERGVLQLYYQPRVSISTGQIVSAEALLRWPHQTGMVRPDAFVPLAEESGLIVAIGAWVLEQAARQQVAWKQAGHQLKISVNVSPRQITEGNFLDVAKAMVGATGCDPRDLELEITERLLLDEQAVVGQTLGELRAMGFSISIDDFGVGYSNLAELHRHPIDCLKIDRMFISNLDKQSALMDMIINMGRLLGLRITAEGVETKRQLAWLRERRCDEAQGFLFSQPVPPAELEVALSADYGKLVKPGRPRADSIIGKARLEEIARTPERRGLALSR